MVAVSLFAVVEVFAATVVTALFIATKKRSKVMGFSK